MNEQSYILDFDDNPHAVIEPHHDDRPFQFHDKLLYAFVPEEEIKAFWTNTCIGRLVSFIVSLLHQKFMKFS